jgi:hypothetical protein
VSAGAAVLAIVAVTAGIFAGLQANLAATAPRHGASRRARSTSPTHPT